MKVFLKISPDANLVSTSHLTVTDTAHHEYDEFGSSSSTSHHLLLLTVPPHQWGLTHYIYITVILRSSVSDTTNLPEVLVSFSVRGGGGRRVWGVWSGLLKKVETIILGYISINYCIIICQLWGYHIILYHMRLCNICIWGHVIYMRLGCVNDVIHDPRIDLNLKKCSLWGYNYIDLL